LNGLADEKGVTIILALHDVDMAIKNCRIAMLVKNGRIVASGKPEDVINGKSIKELFDMTDGQFARLLDSLNNYVFTLQWQE
jgi:iron complex transport system ATP-binding protein